MTDSFSFRSNTDANRIIGNLNRTTQNLASNYEKLSSGLRINRASDDAAGLALASRLSTDVRIFTKGIENVNQGISLMNVAETALRELSSIAQRQNELANQAANETLTHSQRDALHDEANALVDEFNRIVNAAEYNNIKLLDNTFGSSSVQAEGGVNGAINFTLASELARTVGNGTFQNAISYTAGANDFVIDTADFNGDGFADMAVANHDSGDVNLFLNNGNGTFASAVTVSVQAGSNPRGLTAGDVNNDGRVDLVVGGSGNTKVYVLLGNGNGTFGSAVSYAAGSAPFSTELADFNEDGYLDIVSANYTSNDSSVFLNNGNGTFAAQVTVTSSVTGVYYTIAADFNNDGHQDLASVGYTNGRMSVRLGNGNGTFGTAITYSTGTQPRSLAAADFNRDGYMDIVTADWNGATVGGGYVSVFLGNGNGTFAARVSFQAGTGPSGVSVADLDGDGYKDIFTADNNGSTISILRGNGNGTFQSKVSYSTLTPWTVTAADFNNDGALEIAVANAASSRVSVFRSNTTTYTTIAPLNLQTAADATESISIIENIQARVSGELGKVAASQSRFESAVNLLTNKRENFVEAVSRIQDVDVADETAQLIRNKVLQDAGTALLAQANNVPMSMLKLLLDD